MHAHAGSLLSLLDVRACVCVRESAARLCNRVGGSEEQLRVAAELPPSLFPSPLSLSVSFRFNERWRVYTQGGSFGDLGFLFF